MVAALAGWICMATNRLASKAVTVAMTARDLGFTMGSGSKRRVAPDGACARQGMTADVHATPDRVAHDPIGVGAGDGVTRAADAE
ncbi:hypothetical protein Pta02_23930 [Planobispora takensis]|uniref:Uncharacterized protein n=1 Tax=Planobispora takensis TaxID=1367882 RepID=A0A8J3WSD9_9ACTN|nr:hypothetical protein Pta02_23930 [Planobispora takensis]